MMKRYAMTLSALVPLFAGAVEFQTPVALEGNGQVISVESPGYAAPGLGDVTGDGKDDLLVGQFRGGKITVYPGLGDGKFGKGALLKAGGEVAEIPGVW